jgi:cell division protein ZapA
MESPKNRVRVNIYGEEYSIRSEGEPDYIRDVAKYVDNKMREIAERTANRSPARVAILAALNITDELFVVRRKEERGVRELEQRASDIISLLDDTLPEKAE